MSHLNFRLKITFTKTPLSLLTPNLINPSPGVKYVIYGKLAMS